MRVPSVAEGDARAEATRLWTLHDELEPLMVDQGCHDALVELVIPAVQSVAISHGVVHRNQPHRPDGRSRSLSYISRIL
jgi:hypothetical protein